MIFIEHFKNIFLNHSSSQPLAFLIAFLVCYSITPLIRERAMKLKMGERKEGSQRCVKLSKEGLPIPRLGGIGILISIIFTVIFYLAVFGTYTPHGIEHLQLEAIAVGGLMIFFVGLLDDLEPLSPFTKLSSQILAAFTVWLMGLRIEFLANPIHYIHSEAKEAFSLGDIPSLIITVIFIVGITNAINLIDGIDGLAVGVCMIAAIASWAINLSPLLNQPAGALFAATTAGACFGFLRYNFNPARIFLGDNGSYLLGFALACISCIGLTKKITVTVLSPILILIFVVPLVDTLYAIFRRASQKKAILKPDLGHLHHKLLAKGLTEKQINYLLYAVTFTGGLIGTFMLGVGIGIEYLIISSVVLCAWLFFSLVINSKSQKNK